MATPFFPTSTLEKIYQPYLHKKISLGDLQLITHDITVKYRDAGYVLSRAILPAQTVKGGVVKIQVVEGFVDTVTVTGNPGKAAPLLKAYGEHVAASRPLQIKVLERYVLLANDLPGYAVRAVLTPSKTTPGAADLTFATDHKMGSAMLAYDNFGTRYLGPDEVTVSGSAYSMISGGDTTSLRYAETAKGKQLKFYELTHIMPLGTKGTRSLARH